MSDLSKATITLPREVYERVKVALESVEHRYRSMWFEIRKHPRPMTNTRDEWGLLREALTALRRAEEEEG